MKERLKILLLGRGGRESALARKLLESERTEKLYMAPDGVEGAETLHLDPLNFVATAEAVEQYGIDLILPGGEAPIVSGISDFFEPLDVKVIAPDAKCARLEGSKEFAKEFMTANSIPTARFMTVTTDTLEEGLSFLDSQKPPYVLKADGLAMGKGVFIIPSLADAKDMLSDMLEGLFGESSTTVLIEEFLHGKECTVTIAIDGEDWKYLPNARDYKRLLPGDEGVNTAGMGSVATVPFADADFMSKVEQRIILPTLRGLKEEGMDYRGFLYFGVMEIEGEPVLIEYNVRLGDPEAQAFLPLIECDFVEVLEGIADRTLGIKRINVADDYCAAVTVVARGYPGKTERGAEISGIKDAEAIGCTVLPGQLTTDNDGRVLTDGGRVLTVTARGENPAAASLTALAGAGKIVFEGAYFRDDIGRDM